MPPSTRGSWRRLREALVDTPVVLIGPRQSGKTTLARGVDERRGHRILFTGFNCNEPPHVHVEREGSGAKFWLDPLRLERSRGFGRAEIRQIERLVAEKAAFLLRTWHEYFGD